jgi:putative ABC transport system permease protein
MDDFNQDMISAWRNTLKRPGTSLLIIVTLALGIGVNIAIFSMTWHTLLAPLPYSDGERLVTLGQNEASGTRVNFGWSNPTLRDFREQNTVFSELLEYNQWSLTFVGRGEPYRGRAGIVTANFFELLGVQAELGRVLSADDDREGAEPVILLSRDFWLQKFGGDPGVVGTTLEIEHSIYRIAGVLPRLPDFPHANDVWIPQANNPYALAEAGVNQNRRASLIAMVIGKLHEGVSLEEVSAETMAIAQRLAANYPDDYPDGYTVNVTTLKEEMMRDSAVTVVLLMALALLVVLIASANVANLNLARTMARHQELAIREAIGANPGRIARQLLTESLVFALAGGALGLCIAWPCLNLLADFAARYTPLASEIGINGAVLAFSFGLAVVAGIFGSAASIFGRRDINKALKEGGDKVTSSAIGVRKRNALLIMQFALAFVMLTVSALIMLSLWRLNRQDTGFDLDQVFAVNMTINVDLSEPEQISRKMRDFSRNVLAAVSALPEVSIAAIRAGTPLLEQVAYATAFPLDVEGWTGPTGESGPLATLNMVSDSYFTVIDVPLLRGRPFDTRDDNDTSLVAIVNETFATRFFQGGDAVGGSFTLSGQNERYEIVGVVADVRSANIDEVEGPVVYFNYWQFSIEGVNLYVKSAANPADLATTIAAAVHEIDPRQSVLIKPLGEIKSAWLAPTRLRATLISLFGVLALIVTLSGVVGVVSYNISQRVREIGIHMAIGANPTNIQRMFIVQVLKIYLIGLALGCVAMFFAAPLLEPLLYQTTALDPAVYLASLMLLTISVLTAIYLPTRKASSLHPAAALHMP